MEKKIKERIKDTICSAIILTIAGIIVAWLWLIVCLLILVFEG